MGLSYAGLILKSVKEGLLLVYVEAKDADRGNGETEKIILDHAPQLIWLKVSVNEGGKCQFFYSLDGMKYVTANDESFVAEPGKWKGAKLGIFASRDQKTNDAGYAEFDFFRIEK